MQVCLIFITKVNPTNAPGTAPIVPKIIARLKIYLFMAKISLESNHSIWIRMNKITKNAIDIPIWSIKSQIPIQYSNKKWYRLDHDGKVTGRMRFCVQNESHYLNKKKILLFPDFCLKKLIGFLVKISK